MKPETEFNPKQAQNPRDNGFEKKCRIMAYLIQARVSWCSIMYVPCSFAQGSDHSQGLRLV